MGTETPKAPVLFLPDAIDGVLNLDSVTPSEAQDDQLKLQTNSHWLSFG